MPSCDVGHDTDPIDHSFSYLDVSWDNHLVSSFSSLKSVFIAYVFPNIAYFTLFPLVQVQMLWTFGTYLLPWLSLARCFPLTDLHWGVSNLLRSLLEAISSGINFFMYLLQFNADNTNFLISLIGLTTSHLLLMFQPSHHAIDLLLGPFVHLCIQSTNIKHF